ncbi:heme peroxidase superfamily protein [Mycobacteroides abscessus subsp. abscessus]|uniref:hypothetical protein n=1 Tax=Mycobacteroides abscessus TaxID=36809 RepID=UPI00092603F9|nr:hypothetical protein [Mycobacteroides abscessus]MBE5513757.1 hypothetical protein [Mycobacteroides abscessus]MBN7327696.1 hypothetical protein [Mycobacteroides abscessus subsp. abscessus]SID62195.1 heme peroxidase superfamily protein [Mycobacteroides abscessus subsp. abscessus]SIE83408.1 heme peroxidase superfamily protein [Mycobacteroides abscessus subsp. abscessus]SIF72464.1 heme peroxidase superfamily protein [Mycobacteroides abscessus subsp. abscessus]
MPDFTAEQLRSLVASCEQFRTSRAPEGYPTSLALCIIDSIQSTGVRYPSVVKIVDRYRRHRRGQGGDPNADGTAELLATFDELGDPAGWAKTIGNRHRTSTHAWAPLKATAIRDATRVLDAERVSTADALREVADDEVRFAAVESAWRSVTGQGSGITWRYMGMLAGIPGVKPDRMIVRYTADTLNLPRSGVTAEFAGAIVTAAAAEMGISPTDLDHGIWQWQRRRR